MKTHEKTERRAVYLSKGVHILGKSPKIAKSAFGIIL